MSVINTSVAAAGTAVSMLSNESSLLWALDDDDEFPVELLEEDMAEPTPKVEGFVAIISAYTDIDFKSHFRLQRTDVEVLISKLKPPVNKPGRPEVSRETMTLLAIWVLANEESYRGVATRFGLERGNAHRIARDFFSQLTAMTAEYIRIPSGSEALNTMKEFDELRGPNGLPGVFGCVDGTHIPIRSPSTDSGSYYNRKGYHSILLQVVCDAKYKFMDCFAGWPGSANDARVWANSPLGQCLVANPDLFPVNSHLLGDSAYPLSTYLLAPYRDNGHLTSKQKLFNTKLSSKRVVVEQAIGLLKCRFRRLHYLDVAKPHYAAQMTMAACILHNICLRHESDVELQGIDGDDSGVVDIEDDSTNVPMYSIAARKRDAIADSL